MAVTAKELVAKYKKDPDAAKEHIDALELSLFSVLTPILNNIDLSATAKIGAINFRSALNKLESIQEKSDEELEEAFQQMLNAQQILDVQYDEDQTVRDLILSKGNKNCLKDFDTFFGTEFSKTGKVIDSNDEEQLQKLTETALTRTQNASEWIKEFKKIGSSQAEREANQDYLEEKMALIMAARKLAGCKRNDKATLLAANLTEQQVRDEARKLRENGTFKDFMKQVKRNKGWNESVRSAMKKGHAGELDTLFTEFIATSYAPGKMPNDASLKRYMPTVKQRIEALQLREMHSRGDATWAEMFTATGPKPGVKQPAFDYSRASAEILVLRNMIKAARNQKSLLSQQIPADGELQEKVSTLTSDKGFYKIANNHKYKELFAKGHGGKMIEEMRQVEEIAGVSNYAKEIMNANTVGVRLDELKVKASQLYKSLEDEEDFLYDEKDLIKRTKDFVTEYYALNDVCGKKNADGSYDYKDIKKNRLKDVPWNKINQANAAISSLKDLTVDKAKDIMQSIVLYGQEEYFNKISLPKNNVPNTDRNWSMSSTDTIVDEQEDKEIQKNQKGQYSIRNDSDVSEESLRTLSEESISF